MQSPCLSFLSHRANSEGDSLTGKHGSGLFSDAQLPLEVVLPLLTFGLRMKTCPFCCPWPLFSDTGWASGGVRRWAGPLAHSSQQRGLPASRQSLMDTPLGHQPAPACGGAKKGVSYQFSTYTSIHFSFAKNMMQAKNSFEELVYIQPDPEILILPNHKSAYISWFSLNAWDGKLYLHNVK